MNQIELWVIRYPGMAGGRITLTEKSARDKFKYLIKQIDKKKLKSIDPSDFIIEPYMVVDDDLNDQLKDSFPELFL